jgi:foldase protein PrsA
MRCLLLLITFAFIATPAIAATDPVMITVNKEKIRRSEIFDLLWSLQGPEAVTILINRKLILQEAARLKLKADPAEIRKRIDELKKQLPAGVSLQDQLKKSGLTVAKLRDDISLNLLQDMVVSEHVSTKVTEEEMRKTFDENRDRLDRPEGVKVRHIQTATKKQADSIHKDLKKGGDFAALAKKHSVDHQSASKGGELGWVPKGMFRPEIEEVVWGLKKGAYSKVVKTRQGFNIFLVEDRRKSKAAVYKDVASDIKETLAAGKLRQGLPQVLNKLKAKGKIKTFPPKKKG